jgi:recombination protein RecR
MNFSSKIIENAVNELGKLPGVGKRTALRFAIHLLKQDSIEIASLAKALLELKNDIIYCQECHNVSDKNVCEICSNANRDHSLICVVEDIRDVMAIENTQQFRGIYHVLGGIISPMDGIGPSQLTIETLVTKVSKGNIKEVLMALSSTMEGDTTNFYIYKRLKDFNITVSTIARGIAVGDEIEYADEVTLGRSILQRTPYSSTFTLK